MESKQYKAIESVIIGGGSKEGRKESIDVILSVFQSAKDTLMKEPTVLDLTGDYTIVGDIHGNIESLLRTFTKVGYPDHHKFIFLGDYVDRGCNSVEVLLLLFSLKSLFPSNIYLLRGNHECRSLNSAYGFLHECKAFYNESVYEAANECFDQLPVAAILNNSIFLVHGGISQHIHSRDDLFSIEKNNGEPSSDCAITDFLWSDPSESSSGYDESYRGAGHLFNKDVMDVFLSEIELTMIIRSHEACNDGYSLPFGDDGNILTIFSTANYCSQGNDAAIVSFAEEEPLDAKIEIFGARVRPNTKYTLPSFILSFQKFEKINSQISDWQMDSPRESPCKMVSVVCL